MPDTEEDAAVAAQPTSQVSAAPSSEAGSVVSDGAPEETEAVEQSASESAMDDSGEMLSQEELEELRANEPAYTWQASEYVHHEKGPAWYMGLAGGLIALVIVLILMHSWLEVGLFVVMGAAIAVYGARPPRTLTYELSNKGITIENKLYPFEELRAFSVLKDEEWHTIDLEPAKRFSPRLSILFDPSNLEEIVEHLELHLPRIDREPDPIEKAARYLRF